MQTSSKNDEEQNNWIKIVIQFYVVYVISYMYLFNTIIIIIL